MSNNYLSNFILPESINTSLTESAEDLLLNELIQLLAFSNNVTDSTILRRDIGEYENKHHAQLTDHITFPHSRSSGVSGLCAAVGIVKHRDIYVMIAWPEDTAQNLKRISMLVRFFQNIKTKERLNSADNDRDVYNWIQLHLNKL